MSQRSTYPMSCRTVARHSPRKVTLGEPGELRNCPTSSGSCKSAQCLPILADLGPMERFWRSLASTSPNAATWGHFGPDVGPSWPSKYQMWHDVDSIGPNLAKLLCRNCPTWGQLRPNIVNHCQIDQNWPEVRHKDQLLGKFGTIVGQLRSSPGLPG